MVEPNCDDSEKRWFAKVLLWLRKVNAVTEPDAYPLPNMQDILRKLRKAQFISSLDLKSAYNQIPLAEEARPITAFTVPGLGLFQ